LNTKTQLEWRRIKVLELLSQGHSQIEIAKQLQVSKDIINRDVRLMRHESFENMKDYTTRQLPLQLKVFIKALEDAIQTYWKLSQEASDDRDKIEATECYIEAHTTLWSLLSGAESLQKYVGYNLNKQLEVVKLR
jgi:transcriptional regulator